MDGVDNRCPFKLIYRAKCSHCNHDKSFNWTECPFQITDIGTVVVGVSISRNVNVVIQHNTMKNNTSVVRREQNQKEIRWKEEKKEKVFIHKNELRLCTMNPHCSVLYTFLFLCVCVLTHFHAIFFFMPTENTRFGVL
jgi:hypothetical protein